VVSAIIGDELIQLFTDHSNLCHTTFYWPVWCVPYKFSQTNIISMIARMLTDEKNHWKQCDVPMLPCQEWSFLGLRIMVGQVRKDSERLLVIWPHNMTTKRAGLKLMLQTYSGSGWFWSGLGHQLSWLRFCMAFLSPSRQILGYYLDWTMTTVSQVLSYSSFIYL
jgi:hypothetical protein